MPWLRTMLGLKQLEGTPAWAAAIVLCALGILLRASFAGWFDQTPFLPFFGPVAICAMICGWRQAASVLFASAAVAAYFFFRVGAHRYYSTLAIDLRLAGFLCVGGLFIGAIAVMQGAIRRLQSAVHLQESLFRELQHRVANNMQVVAAMLAQTRGAMDDPAARDLVERAEQRIRSMGDLHRRLYNPRGHEGGLESLLRDLLPDLFEGLRVQTGLNICQHTLSTDQLTLIVLLVVEAATNAAKHVFRTAQGSRFDVSLLPLTDGRLCLTISDDGPGFAPAAQAGPGPRRLGMGIMHSLASQLGGTLHRSTTGPGTTLQVSFAAAAAEGYQEGLLF